MLVLYNPRQRRRVSDDADRSAAVPIVGLKQIQVERHDEDHDFFFEQNKPITVSMLTLKRRSHLVAFLIIVCQYAMFDTINFLPVGILLYAVGISLAAEQLSGVEWGPTNDHEIMMLRQREEKEIRKHIEAAMFEYHILRGKPNVQIVRKREHGKLFLYAIHRRREASTCALEPLPFKHKNNAIRQS
jgi:hypothetical protein